MNIWQPNSRDPYKPFICQKCGNRWTNHACEERITGSSFDNRPRDVKINEIEKLYNANIEKHIKEFEERMKWPKVFVHFPWFPVFVYDQEDWDRRTKQEEKFVRGSGIVIVIVVITAVLIFGEIFVTTLLK